MDSLSEVSLALTVFLALPVLVFFFFADFKETYVVHDARFLSFLEVGRSLVSIF